MQNRPQTYHFQGNAAPVSVPRPMTGEFTARSVAGPVAAQPRPSQGISYGYLTSPAELSSPQYTATQRGLVPSLSSYVIKPLTGAPSSYGFAKEASHRHTAVAISPAVLSTLKPPYYGRYERQAVFRSSGSTRLVQDFYIQHQPPTYTAPARS